MVKRMNRMVSGASGGGAAPGRARVGKATEDGSHQTTGVVELAMGATLKALSCLTIVVASSSQNRWHAGLSGREPSVPPACSGPAEA